MFVKTISMKVNDYARIKKKLIKNLSNFAATRGVCGSQVEEVSTRADCGRLIIFLLRFNANNFEFLPEFPFHAFHKTSFDMKKTLKTLFITLSMLPTQT